MAGCRSFPTVSVQGCMADGASGQGSSLCAFRLSDHLGLWSFSLQIPCSRPKTAANQLKLQIDKRTSFLCILASRCIPKLPIVALQLKFLASGSWLHRCIISPALLQESSKDDAKEQHPPRLIWPTLLWHPKRKQNYCDARPPTHDT